MENVNHKNVEGVHTHTHTHTHTDNLENNKNKKGITLIVLVITIIILLILAGTTISIILGENGLFSTAIKATEETKISQYKEQIELIKINIKTVNNWQYVELDELKKAFDSQKSWLNSTEIITDDGIKKIKLITKEGYIFYITGTLTEYKGKGTIKDTSALKRTDAIELKAIKDTANGKEVRITNLAEEYYSLQYQINGTEENKWESIKSGETKEVKHGEILYARLVFGSDYGKTHSMSIAHTNPIVRVETIENANNLTRKTDLALSDIFKVTWGSEGIGQVYYNINGKLKFNDKDFQSIETSISNISELELGEYTITLAIATPPQVSQGTKTIDLTWKVQISIKNLAQTTVKNATDTNVNAYAIWSEYDLAYFRNLINDGQYNINAKVMKTIDLTNVCSEIVGNWEPIAICNETGGWNQDCLKVAYSGIFDGNNETMDNLYINTNGLYRQGLFSAIKENAILKNINISGKIDGGLTSAGIVGYVGENAKVIGCDNRVAINSGEQIGGIAGTNYGNISDCKNNTSITGKVKVGGIVGKNDCIIRNSANYGKIEGETLVGGICGRNGEAKTTNISLQYCYNNAEIKATGVMALDNSSNEGSYAGGITGYNSGLINYCMNENIVEAVGFAVAGIAGRNWGEITYCANSGNIIGLRTVGGIVGNNKQYVQYVYNKANEIKSTKDGGYTVGGICGAMNDVGTQYIKNAYNTSKINGNDSIGGIVGAFWAETVDSVVDSVYNSGTITGNTLWGQICGLCYDNSKVTKAGYKTSSSTANEIYSYIGNKFINGTTGPILNIRIPIANVIF